MFPKKRRSKHQTFLERVDQNRALYWEIMTTPWAFVKRPKDYWRAVILNFIHTAGALLAILALGIAVIFLWGLLSSILV